MSKHKQHLNQIFAAVEAVSEKEEIPEKKKSWRRRSFREEEVSEAFNAMLQHSTPISLREEFQGV